MSEDGMTEIALGVLFTLAGLATLLLPLPIVCCGALIFGPILLVIGIAKAAGAGSRRPRLYAYPPPYPRQYPPPTGPPRAAPPTAQPPAAPVPAGATKTCPRCGRVSVGAKFCPTCGFHFEA